MGCSIADCGGRTVRLGASRAAKLYTRRLSQSLPGIFLLLLMGAGRPAAAECVGGAFGYLVTVQGVVEISTGGGDWHPVKLNAVVCTGDIIRVGQSSRAGIYFDDIETVTYVDQNTTAVAERPGAEEGSLIIRILEGAINFLSREPRSLEIRTPFVNAGVKGTEFEVRVRLERSAADSLAGSTVINLIEGRVEARGAGDTKILASGQSGIAAGTCPAGLSIEDLRQGPVCKPAVGAPAIRVTARAPDTLQWALYYPPITADSAGGLPAELAEVNQLLARGRVDEALPILCADPALGEKSALIAIIELTRNDPLRGRFAADACGRPSQRDNRQRALDFAEQAVRMSPQSAASWVALAYAQQAYGKLEDARESLEKGVEAEPRNALVHARLAEIWLSLGYRDRALEEAATAKKLASNLSRTQTVYGFAALAEVDLNRARFAFTTAIQLDSADPLPRLGLGLAKIRDGDIAAGRRELEIAGGLDPQNSLIRSYLGKAYFEEKRDELAAAQFDLAKETDPKDPTPYLYNAIRLETENRPVEALRDIQKSIELNDNRAVYRSRLQLDEDNAVRSTSLGRIYRDLGFDQVALVEGTKSLSYDPANYSAHRFLSDSYAALPRHEIARSSELLQSQLLQPINSDPVQPQLAETDLNILAGIGPAEVGFNEFTPLFQHDGIRFSASGIVGNEDTYSDEAVLSGIAGRTAFSLGQFHYQTDGFRQNNDLRHDIYDAFGQVALTDDLNVQVEYRHRETEQGDLRLNFDPSNFSRFERRHLDRESARVGLHFAPSPNANFVVSFIRGTDGETITDDIFGADFSSVASDVSYDAEALYLFDSEFVDVTAGVGVADVDADLHIAIDFTDVSGEPCPADVGICEFFLDRSIKQYNAYLYTNINWPSNVTWTVGLSSDSIEQGRLDLNRVNPKLGLQWNVTPDIRLRLAYLQTVKRALIIDQTLEPTQVAGFNQFFDDLDGSRTERYGIALDDAISENLFAGVEISRRNLEAPTINFTNNAVIVLDEHEDLYRGYLYWTPGSHWAVSAEAQFERSEIDNNVGFGLPTEVETTSVPISVKYFSPTGVFAELGATYVHQDVDLGPFSTFKKDSDDFVVVDAALGYRLPDRRGIISLEGRNLLDEKFLFQDLNIQQQVPSNPRFIQGRSVLLRATLNF